LGFGPSAFSDWAGTRFSNIAHFGRYLKAVEADHFPVDFEECLAYPRNLRERLAIGLRLIEGVDLHQLTAKYGPLTLEVEHSLEQLIEKGWIEKWEKFVKLTPLGQLFHDSVALELI
jgi:oxygen-independent coproporphyrinogen-3 oxidase